MTTFNVSDASGLSSALSSASGGDTINLANGSYGSFNFSSYSYASMVTVQADNQHLAIFGHLDFSGATNLTIKDIRVNGGNGKIIDLVGVEDLVLDGIMLRGPGPVSGSYAIYQGGGNGARITVKNCDMQDTDVGPTFFSSEDVTLTNNYVDGVLSDYYKFGNIDGLLFENNTGGGNTYPEASTHTDFVQCQDPMANATFRGNLFLAQNTERPQGIFISGEGGHSNILIENNIIYSGKVNAIYVNDGTGIVAQYNTCLSPPGLGHGSAVVGLPSGSTSQYNIVTNTLANSGPSGTNLTVQKSDSGEDYYVDDYYVNGSVGLGVTIEDLAPVEGSAAETIGAFARIAELLGTSAPPSVPATITVAVTVGA